MKNSIPNQTNNDELLLRISRYLMLHSSYLNNIGLLRGKTGIALFFYCYSRCTQKKLYDHFAGELIDEIYDEIHLDCPRNFQDGLCGIGWGVEYLIRNGFVSADPDDALEELDRQIIERDVRRIEDNSLETGLKGIAYYVISRLAGRKSSNFYLTGDYIADLITALKRNVPFDTENNQLIFSLENLSNPEVNLRTDEPLTGIINKIRIKKNQVFTPETPLGIYANGYTGIGLKLLWEQTR